MAINLIPAALQPLIETGILARRWEDTPTAKLGFRAVADRESFTAGWGETITKTRPGLRQTPQTQLSAANSAQFASGMTPSTFGIEQYTLALEMWGDQAESNLVTEGVAVLSKFKKDFDSLREQANRKVDELARDKLFNAYMGGNTYLVQAETANTVVHVDDTRGFSDGMAVQVGTQTLTIAASGVIANALASSNTFHAKPGTLTFTTAATQAIGNSVAAQTSALVIRPNNKLSSHDLVAADKLTSDMIIAAVAQCRANAIDPVDGFYNLYIDPIHATALLSDSKFLQAFQGQGNSPELVNGAVSHIYGVRLIVQNMSPVDTTGVRRALVVGKGALVESVFTANGYNNIAQAGTGLSHVTQANDIAHIIRPSLDAASMWVTQSWIYIGGFVVPTDIGTNSLVVPTASGRSLKRAVILESM